MRPVFSAYLDIASHLTCLPGVDQGERQRLINEERQLAKDIAGICVLTEDEKVAAYLNYTA